MRRGCNNTRLPKGVLYGSNGAVLARKILGEEIRRITRDLSNKLRRIRRAADPQKANRWIMSQQRQQHLIDGRVGECTKKHGPFHMPYDLGDDFCLPRAGRPPNEMEDIAAYGALDSRCLAGI